MQYLLSSHIDSIAKGKNETKVGSGTWKSTEETEGYAHRVESFVGGRAE